jgi:hypothetical protein
VWHGLAPTLWLPPSAANAVGRLLKHGLHWVAQATSIWLVILRNGQVFAEGCRRAQRLALRSQASVRGMSTHRPLGLPIEICSQRESHPSPKSRRSTRLR